MKTRERILIVPPPQIGGGPSNAILRFARVARRSGVDVTTNMFSAWDAALLNVGVGLRFDLLRLLKLGRRMVFRADGCYVRDIFDKEGNPWRSEYDRINIRIQAALNSSNHVIYQSRFAKGYLDELAPKLPGSYDIVYNGVDLSVFSPGGKKGVSNVPVIGCIGKFRHNRVRTILDITDHVPFKHRLLLVGRMDEKSAKILDESRQDYHQNRSIQYVPAVQGDEELVEQYRMIDCFIHPIIGDTCSNSVIEAMATAVPVVVPAFSGSAEAVDWGGIIVETPRWNDYQGFVEGFAAAISEVIREWFYYSSRARQRAVEVFNIENMALKYMEALSRV